MYEDAIQTALNALSVLEEKTPEESQQLRRLLPALAVHFARAGNHLTEKGILGLVNWAKEENIPLNNLFNETKGQKGNLKSYQDIMARLNPDFNVPLTLEKAFTRGLVAFVREYTPQKSYSDKEHSNQAEAAAGRGQTDLCRYLIEQAENPLKTLSLALAKAAEKEQYHLVHVILSELDKRESGAVSTKIKNLSATTRHSDYLVFMQIYNDFKKSTPSVKPDYFTGLEEWRDIPLRLKPYLQIRDMFSQEIFNVRDLNRASFTATMMFQSKENVLRFLDKWGKRETNPLTSLFSNMEPPCTEFADWSAWGDALIKYGQRMFFPVQFADRLSPVQNEIGQISLRLTREKIWTDFLPHDHTFGPVAELCFYHETSLAVLEKSLALWKRAKDYDPPPKEGIPFINLSCGSAGLKGYRVHNIPYDDPRILFLGYYTGCCEKMGDHFEPTIVDALKTRESGFFVITKDDEIRAHSWVWRGEGGQLIIDGWETEDPKIKTEQLVSVTEAISEELQMKDFEEYRISDIILGRSSVDFNPEDSFQIAHEIARRRVCTWYYEDEGPNQWLVQRIRQPEKYDIYLSPHHYEAPKPQF